MKTEPADTLTGLDDAALVVRAGRRGSPADAESAGVAFHILYTRYSPRLLPFLAARLGRSDADDALQEVWVKIWRVLAEPGRFDGRDFLAWAFKIARNHVTDRKRRKTFQAIDPDGAEPTDPRGNDPDTGLLEDERKAALTRCLGELKAEERAAFECRLRDEDSERIAVRLSIPTDRVYKLVFNAKLKLKACLERSGP